MVLTLSPPVLLFPLAFIPFLPTIIMAGIRSLTLAEHLQEPFFKSKHMNELQQATFVVERQMEFRGLICEAAAHICMGPQLISSLSAQSLASSRPCWSGCPW